MRMRIPERNWWSGFAAGAGVVYLSLLLYEQPESPALRHLGTLFALFLLIVYLYGFWTRRS